MARYLKWCPDGCGKRVFCTNPKTSRYHCPKCGNDFDGVDVK